MLKLIFVVILISLNLVDCASNCNSCVACTDSSKITSVSCGGSGYYCLSTLVTGNGQYTWSGSCSSTCSTITSSSSVNGIVKTTNQTCCSTDNCNVYTAEATSIPTKPIFIVLALAIAMLL